MEEFYDHESEVDFSTKTPENISGDEEAYIPPQRRSRRGARNWVVKVPVTGGGDGYRSIGEVYPPPDSWSWRKYGQKPIKGSPYPRGYYRCSSSKSCPARKQVERSRHDPTTLCITYSSDHDHSLPVSHRQNSPVKNEAASGATSPSSSTATTSTPANFPTEESSAANSSTHIDIELFDDGYYSELSGEFGWLFEMGSTMMEGNTLVGHVSASGQPEMEEFMPIGEEDELLFGDLGDLPEYSLVFGRVDTAGHVAVAHDNFL